MATLWNDRRTPPGVLTDVGTGEQLDARQLGDRLASQGRGFVTPLGGQPQPVGKAPTLRSRVKRLAGR